ncbi:MAG: iron sulfur protein [uncultured bacterium]|nr:MAG: iron sulfur protein [uncultured bacterium]
MSRLVKKTANGPQQVGDKMICMCGLSENQPFCDFSHKKTLTEDESKLYWYENGKAEEIVTEADGCSCDEGVCKGDCHKH